MSLDDPLGEGLSSWTKILSSGDPEAVAAAIYDIGEARARAAAAEVLRAAEAMSHDRVTEQAVWALGKLGYAPATNFIISASHAAPRDIRRGAYWALGELGGPDAARRLEEADRLEQDRALGGVIGGALKKLRGATVRASATVVARRARLPAASDPVSKALLDALNAPDLDHAELVRLREQLQAHDPGLFDRYMIHVREKKRIAPILDSDKVYRDNF